MLQVRCIKNNSLIRPWNSVKQQAQALKHSSMKNTWRFHNLKTTESSSRMEIEYSLIKMTCWISKYI